jgi:apolipoprotein N-acyltransferase
MATNAAKLDHRDAGPDWSSIAQSGEWRYAWLGAGLLAALLSVGGRWDIPLAAWLAPALLLRFSRLSRPAPGLLLIWAVAILSALFWGFQLGVRVQASTLAGHVAFGTVYTLPYIADRLASRRLPVSGRVLLFPAAFAASEFLMATLSPLGTAYGLRAITQSDDLPLLQVIAITGSYGIGFLIALLAAAINDVVDRPNSRASRRAFAFSVTTILVVITLGSARLAFFPADKTYVPMAGITPSGEVLKKAEALNGGAFPQGPQALSTADRSHIRAGFDLVTDELIDSTRRAARAGAKVVVWSETAARTLPEDKPALLAKAADVARTEGIYLNVALGIPFAANETHLFGPDGKQLWFYQKNHPVPGMEPVPPGHTPVPVITTPFGRLANVICFDADFPALTRVNADIMIVPGYDWPEMGRVHTLKMAKLRAIENGYSLIRQDFLGQSAAFDRLGHLLATQDTTSAAQHMILTDVPTGGVRTIYNQIGDLFAWLCVTAAVGLVGLAIARRNPINL